MTSRLPIDHPQTTTPAQTERLRRIPGWRLWVPLLLQTALILGVPAQDAYTYATGRQVTLQTAPVDPYDMMRGYSQRLGYNISSTDPLKRLPGGNWFDQHQKGVVYIVLAAPAAQAQPPKPWQPVRVSGDRPTDLAANQTALKGQYDGLRITYGLETYYMPEDQRRQINAAIGQVNQASQAFVVDVKIDAQGNAVPVSLWVRDHNYRF